MLRHKDHQRTIWKVAFSPVHCNCSIVPATVSRTRWSNLALYLSRGGRTPVKVSNARGNWLCHSEVGNISVQPDGEGGEDELVAARKNKGADTFQHTDGPRSGTDKENLGQEGKSAGPAGGHGAKDNKVQPARSNIQRHKGE